MEGWQVAWKGAIHLTLAGGKIYLFFVWSFLLSVLFGCFFCCLGGGRGAARTEKK